MHIMSRRALAAEIAILRVITDNVEQICDLFVESSLEE